MRCALHYLTVDVFLWNKKWVAASVLRSAVYLTSVLTDSFTEKYTELLSKMKTESATKLLCRSVVVTSASSSRKMKGPAEDVVDSTSDLTQLITGILPKGSDVSLEHPQNPCNFPAKRRRSGGNQRRNDL